MNLQIEHLQLLIPCCYKIVCFIYRASFYRPSMIQSTKRTDVDLTATWHGDMSESLVHPMMDELSGKPGAGEVNSSFTCRNFHNVDLEYLHIQISPH